MAAKRFVYGFLALVVIGATIVIFLQLPDGFREGLLLGFKLPLQILWSLVTSSWYMELITVIAIIVLLLNRFWR